jgi:hypothetical protein
MKRLVLTRRGQSYHHLALFVYKLTGCVVCVFVVFKCTVHAVYMDRGWGMRGSAPLQVEELVVYSI